MKLQRDQIRRILLITLTNVGDIVLTTPVVSALKKELPHARLDIMVGPHGKDMFIKDPRIFKVVVYDKHIPMAHKRRLVQKLKRTHYDLVVDLKNTLFPMLIGSRYRTSPIQVAPKDVVHKKDFHLWKLKFLGMETRGAELSIHVSQEDMAHIDKLLSSLDRKKRIVVVSPTAKSLIKRWSKKGFADLSDRLIEDFGVEIVMIGDVRDREVIDEIIKKMDGAPLNLAGYTTIPQLAYLLGISRLLITNDSAPMHVGYAAGTNVLAIFGPTDPNKYGPRGKNDKIIRKDLSCSPCEVARCRYMHECMKAIGVNDVYKAAKEILKEG